MSEVNGADVLRDEDAEDALFEEHAVALVGAYRATGVLKKSPDDLKPWQQRVLGEQIELTFRIFKLATMDQEIYDTLSNQEKRLLTRQSQVMALYAGILEERIESF